MKVIAASVWPRKNMKKLFCKTMLWTWTISIVRRVKFKNENLVQHDEFYTRRSRPFQTNLRDIYNWSKIFAVLCYNNLEFCCNFEKQTFITGEFLYQVSCKEFIVKYMNSKGGTCKLSSSILPQWEVCESDCYATRGGM